MDQQVLGLIGIINKSNKTMQKHLQLLTIVTSILLNSTLHAATLDRQVISAGGGSIKIGSNTLQYTIGQTFVSTKSAPQVII